MTTLRAQFAVALAILALAAPARARDVQGAITVDPPPPGKGRIVFFRYSAGGMMWGCGVHEGGRRLAPLPDRKYFIQDFDPGVHTFVVQTEAKDSLRVEVEAGETYYVRCSIAMGVVMGRPYLAPSDKFDFDKVSKSLFLQPLD
jgi:hypothetical protein